MIQIIAGKKGSGKTKRLIDMTNERGQGPAPARRRFPRQRTTAICYDSGPCGSFRQRLEEYSVSERGNVPRLPRAVCSASNYDVKTRSSSTRSSS